MTDLESSLLKRERIRRRIEKHIEAFRKGYRHNVGLIGPEGFGKSRLLETILHSLGADSDPLAVYIHAETFDYDHLVERWIEALLRSFMKSRKEDFAGDFPSLFSHAEAVIPKTAEKIRSLKKMMRRGERNAASARELFSLAGCLAHEIQRKILILIDEFHALKMIPAADPFALLGKEIMIEKETLYLVSSSRMAEARDIFHDKLSLLFGNFEVLEFFPWTFDETAEYLERRLPEHVFSDVQKKFLIRMTDGIPFYLELLMDQLETLVGLMPKPDGIVTGLTKGISTEHLVTALHRELMTNGRLSLSFEKRLEACRPWAKDSSPSMRVLLAISEGRRKVLGIATYIDRKIEETKKILARLIQEEMIARRGSFYVLEDPLFRFWLREVYGRRHREHLPGNEILKQRLREALYQALDQVAAEESWDITGRVESLFKEFRNELVEVEHRRLRCPHFSEIAFRPTNGRFFPLIAKKAHIRWVCQIARDLVCEESIAGFVDELKRYRKKVQRKILVALSGIEQNAKLMAQEAEIQIWDLRTFNTLLDLYNLPKIIFMKGRHGSTLGALAQSVPAA